MTSNDLLLLSKDALKLCKEKEYNRIADLIHESYIELIKVESDSRRTKSSTIIRSIQILDIEMIKLKLEYEQVEKEFNLNSIPAIDQYIDNLKTYRRQLVIEKNRFR